MNLRFSELWGAKVSYPPGPEGRTIYAIGDIHGRLDLLEQLHREIDDDKRQFASTRVTEVYLGDYIDRGPDSAGAVSCLIERQRRTEAIFVRGNHEQILLDFLEGKDCLEGWRTFGGVPTMLSYGVEAGLFSRETTEQEVREALTVRLPADHQHFFATTARYCDAKPYLFVHAGIRPSVRLEVQTLTDLLTIRTEFLDFRGDFGRIVVHGHTPVEKPDLRPNRINIDTGAFATHQLTCLRIDRNGPQILGG